LSNGEKFENPRHLRQLADKLATAQRARKRRQATHICSCIGNARRDFHHKLSTRIVREFDYIAVGNVNAAGLAKTRLAKSVLDAGWSSFRNMLRYKATAHGAWYQEVNESFSSRVCSSCGCETGPKGVADLGIRSWICSGCGISHDRDINSALNILFRSGHRTPVEGIPALS
jgi:IS605 OrfB family transposase